MLKSWDTPKGVLPTGTVGAGPKQPSFFIKTGSLYYESFLY